VEGEDVIVGLIADFVVATPEDALQYASLLDDGKPLPRDRFQRAEYKNITPLALGMLWAILRHEPWNVRRHWLEHVSHTEDGERWLFRFPDELVHRLSALNEADQSRIADAWLRTKEVRGELRPILRDLQRLATQTEMTGKSLYLWGSL
jgi:hypothetical protein